MDTRAVGTAEGFSVVVFFAATVIAPVCWASAAPAVTCCVATLSVATVPPAAATAVLPALRPVASGVPGRHRPRLGGFYTDRRNLTHGFPVAAASSAVGSPAVRSVATAVAQPSTAVLAAMPPSATRDLLGESCRNDKSTPGTRQRGTPVWNLCAPPGGGKTAQQRFPAARTLGAAKGIDGDE
ncbi:hypothetical protein GCM10028832_27320 [Streptomyces sparsus]